MSKEDDLDYLSTDDDEPSSVLLDEAAKLKAMRELQAENERLKKEMKEATLNAAAEGYKERLRQEAKLEELDKKTASFREQHELQPPAAAAFHQGFGSPVGQKTWTGPEMMDAFREGKLSNEDIATIIDSGRLVRPKDPGIKLHNPNTL